MNLIKTCPSCGNKIRFPLDKGKIKVKCSCGFNFVADPDDTSIYKNSEFDLTGKKSSRPGISSWIGNLFKSTSGEKFTWSHIINSLLNAKYKLQNFRLLPTSEQKKILSIVIIIAIIIIAVVLIFISKQNKPGENVVLFY
jgi:hypothetical protein